MKIKKFGIIILQSILVACFSFIVWGYLNNLLLKKDSAQKFDAFYEEDMGFDVLFLGTSHVQYGISPMDLWKRYGIASYNLATPGCRMATSYWVLKSAIRHTSPKLVVIDCAYLYDEKAHEEMDYNHVVFDCMPLDKLKFQAIMDLYDNNEDRINYIFPFSLYHERWNELEKNDFEKSYNNAGMGFIALDSVVKATLPAQLDRELHDIDNVSIKYLEKIIEECQENQIEILLTFLPFNADEESRMQAAFLYKIADRFNINYLSPENLRQAINVETDFADDALNNSHLNISGAHKMSYYLGEYISQNYLIPDRRNNADFDHWNDYYNRYIGYKLSLIKKQESLDNYLMSIADKEFNIILDFDNPAILRDEYYARFFENFGVDISRVSDNTDFLLIGEGEEEIDYIENFHESEEKIYISAGNDKIEIIKGENGIYSVYLNSKICYNVTEEERGNMSIRVVLVDKNTMEVIDNARFTRQFTRCNV